jgi:hypothetical protein
MIPTGQPCEISMSGAVTHHGAWLTAVLLLTGSLSGCGGKESSASTAVAGKVSYRGKLLGTGSIVFVPDAMRGTGGDPICAAIGPDGAYKLPGAGIPDGWYRVTVAAVGIGPAAPDQRTGLPYSLLPDKYRDPEASGLSCEVKPGRENTINFNLE